MMCARVGTCRPAGCFLQLLKRRDLISSGDLVVVVVSDVRQTVGGVVDTIRSVQV